MAATKFTTNGLIWSSKILFHNNKLLGTEVRLLHRIAASCDRTCSKFPLLKISGAENSKRNLSFTKVVYAEPSVCKDQFPTKSTFQQECCFRKKQAHNSLLVGLNSKDHIPQVITACEEFGIVENAFSYDGESKNAFLLLEFKEEACIKRFLSNCQYQHISDTFTISSRIVQFEDRFQKNIRTTNVKVNVDHVPPSQSGEKTVSELLKDIYTSEKLSELNIRLRYFFCSLLKDSLSGIFPHCDVLPFGSSVNGIGRQGCDLDIMLRLYPTQNVQDSEFSFLNRTCIGNSRELQKKSIYALSDFFTTFLPGFSSMKKIVHARVPIMKFSHKILGLECDISVNNMSAILMSEILHFCGEIDPRVRPLVYAVKKWAKEANVTYEGPGSWITNFALSLLVIFFLQNRPVPILPPLIDAINIAGYEFSSNYQIEYLMPLSDLQSRASSNDESLALLLKEFLNYIGTQPFKEKHLSVLSGLATEKKGGFSIWVQYPLEEDKNVTKNVSEAELLDMCEKARMSAKFLASNLQFTGSSSELPIILGIPNVLKLFSTKVKNFDLSFLTDETNRKRFSKKHAL